MSEIRSQATPVRDDAQEGLTGSISGFGKSFLGEFEEVDMQALTGPFDKMADYLADHLIDDLGWSKPRTVNSAAELDALPVGSVILACGVASIALTDLNQPVRVWDAGHGAQCTTDRLTFPATVLFTPGDAG